MLFLRPQSYKCASVSLRTALPTAVSQSTKSSITFRRSLVYVNKSSKTSSRNGGSGIKKNPEDYLSVNGVLYPGTVDTLKPTKDFLGSEYALPDELILQILTHKSFAHGLKPYNENLAIIGRHFLRLQAFIHATSQKSENPTALNGVNFDVSLSNIAALLSATAVSSEVCRSAGIDKNIFWKAPNDQVKADTVYAKTIDALVGAILMRFGQNRAQQFVSDKLLSGQYSLIDFAAKIYK